jgi:hypothetical protein
MYSLNLNFGEFDSFYEMEKKLIIFVYLVILIILTKCEFIKEKEFEGKLYFKQNMLRTFVDNFDPAQSLSVIFVLLKNNCIWRI